MRSSAGAPHELHARRGDSTTIRLRRVHEVEQLGGLDDGDELAELAVGVGGDPEHVLLPAARVQVLEQADDLAGAGTAGSGSKAATGAGATGTSGISVPVMMSCSRSTSCRSSGER